MAKDSNSIKDLSWHNNADVNGSGNVNKNKREYNDGCTNTKGNGNDMEKNNNQPNSSKSHDTEPENDFLAEFTKHLESLFNDLESNSHHPVCHMAGGKEKCKKCRYNPKNQSLDSKNEKEEDSSEVQSGIPSFSEFLRMMEDEGPNDSNEDDDEDPRQTTNGILLSIARSLASIEDHIVNGSNYGVLESEPIAMQGYDFHDDIKREVKHKTKKLKKRIDWLEKCLANTNNKIHDLTISSCLNQEHVIPEINDSAESDKTK